MTNFLFNRLIYSVLTLFGVVTLIFFLFNVLPGDPAQMMLGQNQNSEQLINVKKKYGFDQPISTQYFYYLNDLSPISFHSNNQENYTFLKEDKYSETVSGQVPRCIHAISHERSARRARAESAPLARPRPSSPRSPPRRMSIWPQMFHESLQISLSTPAIPDKR